MKKQKTKKGICTNIASANGITLIALIITIIVLIILAGIAISLTLGENGIFTKAKEAAIKQDIEETRELIKLELIGSISEETADYTNKDVIDAIKKVTGKEVTENENTVLTKKENEADISDFWKKDENFINFTINGKNFSCKKGIYLSWDGEDSFLAWLEESGEIPQIQTAYVGAHVVELYYGENAVYVYGDEEQLYYAFSMMDDAPNYLRDGDAFFFYFKEGNEYKLIPLAD